MVIASHVIFGAYGFWLPNDPRAGSWSQFVGSWELYRFGGPAKRAATRRSAASAPHDVLFRKAAKERLAYPAVTFSPEQTAAVGRGFGRFADKSGLRILACEIAILPEHVHLVIARHRYPVEQAVTLLKGEASRVLAEDGLHPMAGFPRCNGRFATCWARGEWKVFLNSAEDLARAVGYVERNPVKEGRPVQSWGFVQSWEAYVRELWPG